MSRIRFRQGDAVLEVSADATPRLPAGRPGSLLARALEAGADIPHACGGFSSCGTCHVVVLAGAELLSPVEAEEASTLPRARGGRLPGSRLACQCAPVAPGEIEVEIPGGAIPGIGGGKVREG